MADDGCRLWTSRTGSGTPLVLVGGGPGLADGLGDIAEAIRHRFHTTRWDQRGCGRSEHRGPYTLARSIADLAAVTHDTSSEPVFLLGHSWGATLALHYALTHPDRVRGLIYVSGTGAGTGWKAQWRANTERTMAATHRARITELSGKPRSEAEERELVLLSWTADFADAGTALQLADRLAQPWFPVNYECNAALNAEADALVESQVLSTCAALTVPVLIIHGDRDPRPVEATDSLCATLPCARRRVMEGVGHVPWLEAPEHFSREIIAFADKVASTAGLTSSSSEITRTELTSRDR
jgi:proline iminopeptidase